MIRVASFAAIDVIRLEGMRTLVDNSYSRLDKILDMQIAEEDDTWR